MLFTQETGNSLILEWYQNPSNKDNDTIHYVGDYNGGYHAIIGYDPVTGNVNQVKLYAKELDSNLITIHRNEELVFKPEGFNLLEGDFSLNKFLQGEYPLNSVYLTKLLVDKMDGATKPVILINSSDNFYTITAFEGGDKLVYHKLISAERMEDVLYLITACSQTFFKSRPAIFIESELDIFEKMKPFLEKYFSSVQHLYQSIKTLVPGLEVAKIIDINCILSTSYINLKL